MFSDSLHSPDTVSLHACVGIGGIDDILSFSQVRGGETLLLLHNGGFAEHEFYVSVWNNSYLVKRYGTIPYIHTRRIRFSDGSQENLAALRARIAMIVGFIPPIMKEPASSGSRKRPRFEDPQLSTNLYIGSPADTGRSHHSLTRRSPVTPQASLDALLGGLGSPPLHRQAPAATPESQIQALVDQLGMEQAVAVLQAATPQK